MSDAELLLLVESRKKSGWLAAALNLFLPGTGYIYCGRWFLGLIAFFFVVAMFVVSLGYAAIGIAFLLFIDGFLCAGRYNKNLITTILKDRKAFAGPQNQPVTHLSDTVVKTAQVSDPPNKRVATWKKIVLGALAIAAISSFLQIGATIYLDHQAATKAKSAALGAITQADAAFYSPKSEQAQAVVAPPQAQQLPLAAAQAVPVAQLPSAEPLNVTLAKEQYPTNKNLFVVSAEFCGDASFCLHTKSATYVMAGNINSATEQLVNQAIQSHGSLCFEGITPDDLKDINNMSFSFVKLSVACQK